MISLIEMNLYGAVLITVIILIRSLTIHRLPKKTFFFMWSVALVRLLIPVRISSPASIYTVAPNIAKARRTGILLPDMAEQTTAFIPGKEGFFDSPWMIVWLVGGLLLAIGILFCHIKNRQIYRTSLPVESPWMKHWMETHRLRRPVFIRCSDQIDAPLTYGVLWPIILLPAKMDWSDETVLGFVLAHEMFHIRRFDALTKWFLAAVLCLHWFNPLVWGMYILANRDLELSCDEAVLRLYGPKSRTGYALALVSMEEQRSAYAPLANCFCRSALKERITAVMKFHKKSAISLSAAVVLLGILITFFATSAPVGGAAGGEPQSAETTNQLNGSAGDSGAARDIAMETVEESVYDSVYGREPSYTKAQYNDLMEDIKLDGYEEMPIAEFNRKIYALLSSDHVEERMLFEQILASVPADDPDAAYLCNTVQASLEEYTARMEEVFSGKQNDPEFYGSASTKVEKDVFGDKVVTGNHYISYEFTYRILDQNKLTVGERDDFLQNIIRAVQDYADKHVAKTFTKEEFQKLLMSAGEEAATEKISFTGGEITSIESY